MIFIYLFGNINNTINDKKQNKTDVLYDSSSPGTTAFTNEYKKINFIIFICFSPSFNYMDVFGSLSS